MQLGKPGRSNQTTARCCHKCGETFWRAVPNLCCLCAENCQTARQSGLTSYPNKCEASLVAQLVKNLPAMQETWVQFLGWEDPLEKEMATHSSILAWRVP